MSHSHIPVRHLIKQVEVERAAPRARDRRPQWISRFIDRVAALFEPLFDDARAGFECRPTEQRWVVGMYLGRTEIVGGREDGQARHIDFQFDLLGLTRLFDSIDAFRWSAFPGDTDDAASLGSSLITVDGCVNENPLRLRIFSVPPCEAEPAVRKYPDGRCEPA